MADADLTLLLTTTQRTLTEVQAMRRELKVVSDLAISTSEHSRRVARRIEDLRDDLELMIKSELGGRLAHVATEIEHQLSDRIEASERLVQDLAARVLVAEDANRQT